MGWGADGSAFAITGALFLLCGAIASSSVVRARLSALVSILMAASVFIAAAILSRSHGGWTSSPWIWSFALLPIVLIAFLGARAAAGLQEEHSMSRCLAPQMAAQRMSASASEAADVGAASPSCRASNPTASGTELADLAYAHPELRVAIAANPATPANVLGWLASSGGDGVADAIARRGSEDTQRSQERPSHKSTDGQGGTRESGG